MTKSFQGNPAVTAMSFSVNPGEVVGVLGPNGAGKSTTLRMIAGVLEPDLGSAELDGFDIMRQRRAAQARLGYMAEGTPLYMEMHPLGFLRSLAALRGLHGPQARWAVDRAIHDTRLENVTRQPIETLSKGFRRRVGLAAAILHDPPVLILDEPTDGLDPNQKRVVRALIQRLTPGKAILISTHALEDVTSLCSRAVLIHRGRLIEDDTPEGLAARAGAGDLDAAFHALTRDAETEAAQ
jgi:ABC-2 type transport system ATP-binding protein